MKPSSKIHAAIRRALLATASAALAAPAAFAQDAPQDEESQPLEQVVVTGSRIARPDFTADSPIVSLTDEMFERVAATSVEQVLNAMPQFVPSVTSTSNNPSNNGQANIDLRGLGTNRNIVLMNGRRLPIANANGTVDVNVIPTALIERVDIVTGGASAVYGSDAIAGVVNFVLKDDFEGVDVESSYGKTDEDDSEEWMAGLTLGSNFADDQGNAVFHLGYTERKPVLQGAREFSFMQLDIRRQGNVPLGSGTFEQGRATFGSNAPSQAAIDAVFGGYGNYTPGSVAPSRALGTNPDGTLFSAGAGIPNQPVVNFRGDIDQSFNPLIYTYNFQPPNILNMPVARYNFASFLDFDLSEATQAYAHAIYTDYDTRTQLAPTPAGGLQVPVTNPFIPDDLATVLASRANPNANFSFARRMTEVGPRVSRNEYKVWQFLGGLRGDVGEDYKWDLFAAKAQMDLRETQDNDISVARISELLSAPDGGVALCGGFDPFGAGEVSAACADYVRTYFTNTTRVDQTLAEASFSGKLFQMPAGLAQFSVGAGYHEDAFDFAPDAQVASGDLVGFNQQDPLRGAINSTELFAEARLPLIGEKPLVQTLELTLGYRWSDYSLSGSANAYKGELNWQVADPFRVRTSFNRAVRAPSVAELFTPANQGFPPLLEDPCEITSIARAGADGVLGTADDPGSRAQVEALCVAQGVDDIDTYTYGFTQVESFAGGNPALDEETADTLTFGFVVDSTSTNPWIEKLRLSVDYWNIKLNDAIFLFPSGELLLLCFNYQGGNPTYDPSNPACQSIDRADPDAQIPVTNGPVVRGSVLDNVSELQTSGIDLQLDWGFDLGRGGRLATNTVVSYLDQFDVTYRDGLPIIDRVGTIGDGGESVGVAAAYPEYKVLFNTDYRVGDFRLGARYRFIPSMENKYRTYDNSTTVGTPSVSYFDVDASWYITDAAEIAIGAINVTDKQPPLYTNPPQMNTDPSTYDVLGRRFFARASYKF